ncbi:hypothetical protein J1614_008304 [Plenodomus biglobosus]|nr:hypothetical protein J1614_008304 [Plenodomus biglobosus]
MKYASGLLYFPLLVQAASNIYTGFNYGAFWGAFENSKRKADFIDGFTLARNLSTPIPFDSARIFTCIQPNTPDDPIEAFDAAVETKTNLLLGFWISPAKRGDSPDPLVKKEMLALEKGFQKHGQALSDLVIGLSVGNEDIYRWNTLADDTATPPPSGLSAEVVSATIANVKKLIAASSFAKFMENKPIGHVDTAHYTTQVTGGDFIGMTAYPWWNHEGIDVAKNSFLKSLEMVKKGAGDLPVWIAEIGWPFHSELTMFPQASAQSMQRYWTEVGCSVLGQYTTFWFQLLKDSTADQPDWGLLDIGSRQPRITDLSCPSIAPSASAPPNKSSQAPPPSTLISPSTKTSSPSSSTSAAPSSPPPPANNSEVTTHVQSTTTTTRYATMPTSAPSGGSVANTTITSHSTVTISNGTRSPNPTAAPRKTWCVTEADVFQDGRPMTVAGGPVGADGKCSSPPPYYGHPYITSGASVKPTGVPRNSTWCVTMADVDRNGRPVPVDANPAGPDGKCVSATAYYSYPYVTRTSSMALQPSTPPPPAASVSPSAIPAPLPTSPSPPQPPPRSTPPGKSGLRYRR